MVAYIFLSELCNYVLSFVVGIIVPFKYIDNKTSMICTRDRTRIFFILFFVTYIEYLRFINFPCGNIETNSEPFQLVQIQLILSLESKWLASS